jgi:vacuolar-type H+-ATPase catalytic subunit A/Vma1
MDKLTFTNQILNFLEENPNYEYTISDLSRQFKIPVVSVYNILWHANQLNVVDKIVENKNTYWSINTQAQYEKFHHVSAYQNKHKEYLNKIQKVLNKSKQHQFQYKINGTKKVCIDKKDFLNVCVKELECSLRTAYNLMKYLIVIEYFVSPYKKYHSNLESHVLVYNANISIHDYLNNLNQ